MSVLSTINEKAPVIHFDASSIKRYRGCENLKASGQIIPWTNDMLLEYSRCSEDIIYFVENYLKILHVDKGRIPFRMWDFQKDMLRSIVEHRMSLFLCPRQVGKTSVAAAFFIWFMLFHADKTMGILANKEALSQEIVTRIQNMYELLPLWLQQGIVGWIKNKAISLENGSCIISASASKSAVRGFSFSCVLVDEVAFVKPNDWAEFYKSMYPTLSSGKETRLILVSTPNGLNHYYSLVESARKHQSTFHLTEISWDAVPGRDEEWKKLQIANTSEEDFRQEFLCEFIGTSRTLISSQKLKQIGATVEPYVARNEDVLYWKKPEKDHQYMITCDTARGLSLDYSVLVVFDISTEPFEVVAIYRDNTVDPMIFPEFIANIGRAYNDAWVLCELNDAGEHVASNLRYEHNYEYMLGTTKKKQFTVLTLSSDKKVKKGLTTTKKSKTQGCTALRNLIERDLLKVVQEPLFVELCNFTRNDNGSFNAEEGANDDIVMCCVLFAWATTQEVFKKLIDRNVRKSLFDINAEEFGDSLPIGFVHHTDEPPGFFTEDGIVWCNLGEENAAWDNLFGG